MEDFNPEGWFPESILAPPSPLQAARTKKCGELLSQRVPATSDEVPPRSQLHDIDIKTDVFQRPTKAVR
jgi:hypothetical protein